MVTTLNKTVKTIDIISILTSKQDLSFYFFTVNELIMYTVNLMLVPIL